MTMLRVSRQTKILEVERIKLALQTEVLEVNEVSASRQARVLDSQQAKRNFVVDKRRKNLLPLYRWELELKSKQQREARAKVKINKEKPELRLKPTKLPSRVGDVTCLADQEPVEKPQGLCSRLLLARWFLAEETPGVDGC